jgi:hypothetical protein
MSRFLSESNIELIENFIVSKQPTNSELLPAISECYREDAVKDWKSINDPETPNTSYFQFASDAFGMSSYGFYKSKCGQVFLINAFCNKLVSYYNVPDDWYIIIPFEEQNEK